MIVKKGASIEGTSPKIKHAIEVVDKIYLAHGIDQGVVVTSGTEGQPGDGVHKHDSLHYTGNAFDCRIWVFKKVSTGATDMTKVKAVAKQIREALGKDYDVLVESDHIHIEYDPKSTLAAAGKSIKSFVDIVIKFIGDITPFFRMAQNWWKGRK